MTALVRTVRAILHSVALIFGGETLHLSLRNTLKLPGRTAGSALPVLVCSAAGLQIFVEAGAVSAAADRTLRSYETEFLAGQLRARVVSAWLALLRECFYLQQLRALIPEDDAGVAAQVVSHNVGRRKLSPVEQISAGGDCQAVRSDEQVVSFQNSFPLVSSVVVSLYSVGEGVAPIQAKLIIIHR